MRFGLYWSSYSIHEDKITPNLILKSLEAGVVGRYELFLAYFLVLNKWVLNL